MPDEFKGDPSPLKLEDYEEVAASLGCTVAAIRAVAEVESAGDGYLRDGRPKILFERHIFHRQSGGKFTSKHPDISFPKGGGYIGNEREYDRLKRAIALDEEAALKSASWGQFQIMGFNHKICGHANVKDFVKAMVGGRMGQLKAFAAFIKANHLADELQRLDWRGFARGYNGPAFEKFNYHNKMDAAYRKYSQGGSRTENPVQMLKIGDDGQAVLHLQQLLGITTDGDFGPATKDAVIAFQKKHNLYADGIVGQQTWAILLAGEKPDGKKQDEAEADPVRTLLPLRIGDRGDDVAFLQEKLNLTPADGIFGAMTGKAVVEFQKANGLTADGIVGKATWAKLLDGD